jgi:hypothetical protein
MSDWSSAFHRQWFSCVLACLIACIASSSCGPKTSVYLHERSFTPSLLKARGLAVGGMTWGIGRQENRATINAALDTLLWRRLGEDLDETEVKPLTFLDGCLGESARSDLLRRIFDSRSIEPADSGLVKMGLCDTSVYVVFGIVLSTTVDSQRVAATSKGEKDLNILIRRARANFRVFDAATGKLVWNGDISAWKSTGKSAPEERGFLDGLAHDLVFGEEPEFPDAPSVSSVIWKLFGGLTDKLQHQK